MIRRNRSNVENTAPEMKASGNSDSYGGRTGAKRVSRKQARRRSRGATAEPCSLCPVVSPSRKPRPADERIDKYQTAQQGALFAFIARHYPGIPHHALACHRCLERIERQMQQQQLVVSDGNIFYADPSLGSTPILSTPDRMNASRRYTGRGVTIAFVDSGFYPHPDLLRPVNRIVAMYDAVFDRNPGSIQSLTRKNPGVEEWHGTMTACAAAGSGYKSGGLYRGLACDADVILIKVMTPKFAIQTPQVVRALRWIKRNHERYNIRVVNMSLGVDEQAKSMEHPVIALVEELTALGIVVVAAAGNHPMHPIVPPGAAPSTITVGGYNDNNSTEFMRRELWMYSRGQAPDGTRKPELLAPAIWVAAPILPRTQVKLEAEALFRLAGAGDSQLMKLIPKLASRTVVGHQLLKATSPVYARSLVLQRIAEEKLITADYKHVDGTSFSAPIVASIVAQMLEARPSLTPAEVKLLLVSTAKHLPNVPPDVQGYGVVQADRAIETELQVVAPPDYAYNSMDRVSPWERLPS